jgi:hypothetical protein
LNRVVVRGIDGDDRLVISAEKGLAEADDDLPVFWVAIEAGAGRNSIDARQVQAVTIISTGGDEDGTLLWGSATFFDTIELGAGDAKVFTGAGGSFVWSGFGDDELHLGEGADRIILSGHDTIFGLGRGDRLVIFDPCDHHVSVLDTNGDGRLSAADAMATVSGSGSGMTVDFAPMEVCGPPGSGSITATLVGRTSIDLDRIDSDCD